MASAQVLPSSRKQEHLAAGKRRLEEFRKKKAAERAKKAASSSQSNAHDVATEHVRDTESDGAGTSDGPTEIITSGKADVFSQKNQQIPSNGIHGSNPPSINDYVISSADFVPTHVNNQEIKKHEVTESVESMDVYNSQEAKDSNNDFEIHNNSRGLHSYGSMPNNLMGRYMEGNQGYDSSSSKSSLYEMEESHLKGSDSSIRVPAVINPAFPHDFGAKVSSQISGNTVLQSKSSDVSMLDNGPGLTSNYEGSIQPATSMSNKLLKSGLNLQGSAEFGEPGTSNYGERMPNITANSLTSLFSDPFRTSESSAFAFDNRSSVSELPLHSVRNETNARRSRPSFLDSLNVSRASSGACSQHTELEEGSVKSSSLQVNGVDGQGSYHFQNQHTETNSMGSFTNLKTPSSFTTLENPTKHSASANNGALLGVNDNSMEGKHEFYSNKQNEDFAALEQHIEDLTQEKFSLQRALEASRALAESLAAENSSLTDSYNQQRSIVNQLKSDMEMLQEEIKAHLLELESFKNEYANARLECNAADERASILASEVIGLEEKALRLRSNELKLERQLENSHAEISSCKKKMSSLEKDRQDLQSTINALQEEKKVLQSKLRKASTNNKSVDVNQSPTSRKDISTSTEDLDVYSTSDSSNQEADGSSSLLENNASISPLLAENGSALEVLSVNIPSDQMRMIQNINALISELMLEKEEMTQALSSEISQSSKLKEFNKELSRKLEAQTQRLELLTAQNMANDNISARQPDSHTIQENTAYADEGDEVVERVLGWIMKLFPGGPSRRRTSKLL
ncbi:protein BLISTER isoform X2 [Carica papaya]|uniref:protein BLISTER isoform X2 n=1 Tax=Carica papaya TaxID=3649 RepID=UPI000B8CDDEE|nr:protein BLISTER isoform X2 [Carica papaya]